MRHSHVWEDLIIKHLPQIYTFTLKWTFLSDHNLFLHLKKTTLKCLYFFGGVLANCDRYMSKNLNQLQIEEQNQTMKALFWWLSLPKSKFENHRNNSQVSSCLIQSFILLQTLSGKPPIVQFCSRRDSR